MGKKSVQVTTVSDFKKNYILGFIGENLMNGIFFKSFFDAVYIGKMTV